jgi:tetratricopeptide (TPR) repeat protein
MVVMRQSLRMLSLFFAMLFYSTGCGNSNDLDSQTVSSSNDQAVSKKEQPAKKNLQRESTNTTVNIEVGRNAWRDNNYKKAVESYLALDLKDKPDLLFERGRLLLEVADFYEALGEFATIVKTDLLLSWESHQKDGYMYSSSLYSLSAMNAYRRGNYIEAAAYEEAISWDDSAVVSQLGQIAVAMGLLHSENADRGEVLIDSLIKKAVESPVLSYRLRRNLLEKNLIERAKKIPQHVSAKTTNAPFIENEAIVDLSWLKFYEGDIDGSLNLMKRHHPDLPLVQEEFIGSNKSGSDSMPDMTRKIYSLHFIGLLAKIYFELASRDFEQALSDEGPVGLQALYFAGLASDRAGFSEESIDRLSEFSKRTESTTDAYIEFLRYHSEILISCDSSEHVIKKQVDTGGQEKLEGEKLRQWAIEATRLYECNRTSGKVTNLTNAESLGKEIIKEDFNSLSGTDRYYFYEATLKTALVLLGGEPDHIGFSRILLEKIYNKASAYKPTLEKPLLLIRLAQAYQSHTKVDWVLSKTIIEYLGVNFEECVPVANTFAYLQATVDATGGVVHE